MCLVIDECSAIMWYNEGYDKGKCHLKNDESGDPVTCDICVGAYRSCIKIEGKYIYNLFS